ncbi:glycine betaine/L-proline ABC transporter substrate-binding protein ProX [Roseofilum capinflatum]|uniref:Glycine betaine/L-proline ABC transporter substrate-binding protein ProX n=1 Tax=Roseofilum capinflatum BLCC-M114 TaxID=3022440 RepID=A0ABT7B8V4_9CYAN|nr:glycine betaine/L-proline ABC transporter substrate-binding protein ProX [Roseofilum capinflatum]MDJ1175601.1 glycine betaine/L-proline ABC transporter substrate-binding protein ProX [Roseofilum capinflatum BLCC-M114]
MIQSKIRSVALGTIVGGLLFGAISCGNTTTETSSDLPGAGTTLTHGQSSILEEHFQSQIINKALEQLGYETQPPKELTYPTLYAAIGNGDIDYTAVNWDRLHTEFYENSGGDEKLAHVGVLTPSVLQGYQIDKKTADEYNITSLEQLKDPEIAQLFDTDGNGKANLTGCDPGWGCELVIEHHLDAYGLRDTVEHDQGQYSALIADTMVRYQEGESILFYTWTPYWVGGVLKPGEETIWLEVPYTDLPEGQGEVSEADTTANGKNLGFVVDRIRVVANKEFVDANPAAEKLFELVEIPLDDINAQNMLIQEGEDQPEDIERHVNQWIADNQELFDSWVEQAMEVES